MIASCSSLRRDGEPTEFFRAIFQPRSRSDLFGSYDNPISFFAATAMGRDFSLGSQKS
jgi:hypothetical protein